MRVLDFLKQWVIPGAGALLAGAGLYYAMAGRVEDLEAEVQSLRARALEAELRLRAGRHGFLDPVMDAAMDAAIRQGTAHLLERVEYHRWVERLREQNPSVRVPHPEGR